MSIVEQLETYLKNSDSFITRIMDNEVIPILETLLKDPEAVEEAKKEVQHFDMVFENHSDNNKIYRKMTWIQSFVSDLYMKRYH